MNRVSMRIIVLVAALALAAVALTHSGTGEPIPPSRTSAAAPQNKLIGVAGCAAMACHGGTRPNERGEYTTWIQHDRHARAFSVLYDELSQHIARNLGIEHPEQGNRCLACHATGVKAPRGERFAIEDGVSCEACHGAAEKWLVPHSLADWKKKSDAEKYGSSGMVNTKDVVARATVCVQCHVGAADREVNHDLIAAGHPPLVFELDAFTANMPPHWRETPDKMATFGAQAWAVGQAVAMKQSLELLQAQAERGQWPEFAQFECSSCHHSLKEKSWRQSVGYGDRAPGSPVWSNPQWLLAQRVATSSQRKPGSGDELTAVQRILSKVNSAAPEVASATEKALATASQLVYETARENWTGQRLHRLLADLAAEPNAASLDYAVASHITMALGAVFEATVRADAAAGSTTKAWSEKVRPKLDRLYDDVQRPADFNASQFTADLKEFRDSL